MDTRISPGYELEIEEFKGPLESLLALIDERKLEITRLNLAEVTADFLTYLEKLEEISHKELANFVVVAARLVLIKSHALLPSLELSEEEERDIAELERRLKLYKEFRQVEGNVEALWGGQEARVRPFLASVPPGFHLTEEVKPQRLQEHFKRLVEMVEDLRKLETEEVEVINLEEQIATLLKRINSIFEASFADLSSDKEKPEVVVMFLALLHLLKDNQVDIVQDQVFGEIKVLSIDGKK